MNVPSKNMRLSATELNKMVLEHKMELYAEEQEKTVREQAAADRALEEHASKMQGYINEQVKDSKNRSEFLQNVKEAFLSECIMKLYRESTAAPMTRRDRNIARNLVNRFVHENGAGNLVNDFSTRSMLLSEMARITMKYYNKVLEDCTSLTSCEGKYVDASKPGEAKEYKLSTTIKDDFYNELDDLDCDDASKLIKDRVADAIQQFVDSNSYAKMEYEDIINQAKEKIASIDTSDDSDPGHADTLAEEYSMMAKRKINEMKLSRPKNVFNIMVEALTRKVLTDDSYKAQYMNESTVDMESIVDSTTLIYTMLEMVNTTRMVNVNEAFINEYLKGL
jgi:hypothetical protein